MNVFVIFLLSLSLVGLFYFSSGCCSKRLNCCVVKEGKSTQSVGYLQYGMVIFGSVAALWYVGTIGQCAESFDSDSWKCSSSLGRKDEKIDAIETLLHSILQALFIVGEMLFVVTHSKVRFVKGWTLRIFLLHLLATNYGLWFRTSLNEAHERSSRLSDTCNKTVAQYYCFAKNVTSKKNLMLYQTATESGFGKFVNSSEPFVYPSIAEFCLSTSAIIFNMWLFMDDETENAKEEKKEEKKDEKEEEKEDVDRETQTGGKTPLLSKAKKIDKRICIRPSLALFAIFLLVSMILAIICSVIDTDKQTDTIPTTFYVAVQQVTASISIISSIIGLVLLKKRDNSALSTHVLIESALLLIALLGTYIAQALQLSATVNTHSKNTRECQKLIVIYSINSGLYLVLGLFQSFFIIGGLQSRNMNRRNQTNNQDTTRPLETRLLQLITLILLLCNVNLWISRTYEMSGLHCNALFTTFYENTNWAFLSDVFYPLWIFFHFHSAASCWDILKGL